MGTYKVIHSQMVVSALCNIIILGSIPSWIRGYRVSFVSNYVYNIIIMVINFTSKYHPYTTICLEIMLICFIYCMAVDKGGAGGLKSTPGFGNH